MVTFLAAVAGYGANWPMGPDFIFLRSNVDGLLGAQTNQQVVKLDQLVINANYPRRCYP